LSSPESQASRTTGSDNRKLTPSVEKEKSTKKKFATKRGKADIARGIKIKKPKNEAVNFSGSAELCYATSVYGKTQFSARRYKNPPRSAEQESEANGEEFDYMKWINDTNNKINKKSASSNSGIRNQTITTREKLNANGKCILVYNPLFRLPHENIL